MFLVLDSSELHVLEESSVNIGQMHIEVKIPDSTWLRRAVHAFGSHSDGEGLSITVETGQMGGQMPHPQSARAACIL